jgi:hypothetical protein
MAIAQAAWTHGHSLEIEYPNRGSLARKGFSARWTGRGQDNWLHLAIPTPVIVNGKRLRVGSVLVRFRTGGATVKAIHVYDGEKKIAARANLLLKPGQWHVERVDVPGDPEVLWGVGISMLAGAGPDGGWVEVSAAGCDLL